MCVSLRFDGPLALALSWSLSSLSNSAGANDVVMPVEYSDQAAAALRAVGSKALHLQYTRLESAPAPVGWPHYQGHAAWIPTYAADSPLWPWLAQQVLSASDQELGGHI